MRSFTAHCMGDNADLYDLCAPIPARLAAAYDGWDELEPRIIALVQPAYAAPLDRGCIVAADQGPVGPGPRYLFIDVQTDVELSDAAKAQIIMKENTAGIVIDLQEMEADSLP